MSKRIDLTGQHFTCLTVTRLLGKNRHGRPLWECKCDCGKSTKASTNDLRSGNTKSCGCLSLKKLQDRGKDLAGRRFGRLVAFRLLPDRNERGQRIWLCRCDCGREKAITANDLFSGRTKSCGCLRNENRSNPKVRRKTARTLQRLSKKGWILTHAGEQWYSRRAALELLDVNQGSLEKWAKGSAYLEGKGIAVIQLKSPAGKVEAYYLEKDLIRLLKARAGFVTSKEPPNHVSREDAEIRTGLSYAGLKKWARKLRVKRRYVKGKDSEGKLCRRVCFPGSFVAAICEKRQTTTLANGSQPMKSTASRGIAEPRQPLPRPEPYPVCLAGIDDHLIDVLRRNGPAPAAAAPPPIPPPVAGHGPEGDGYGLTAMERAIQIYLRNPNQSTRSVARQVGCSPSLLSGNGKFKSLREAYQARLPRGSKSKDGVLEAVDAGTEEPPE